LYGTTSYGGSGGCVLLGTLTGCGTVFELSPPKENGAPWTEKVLYSFKSGKDGYLPNGDLTADSAGNLYGVTLFGGGKGAGLCDPFYEYCGTAFKLTRPNRRGGKWTETVLHSFAAGTDGYAANGGLFVDKNGGVYGTTEYGGDQLCNFGQYKLGCGIAFRIEPPEKLGGKWTYQILHLFVKENDGHNPSAGLISDGEGSLYGTCGNGGSGNGFGVVYRLKQSPKGVWNVVALYSFQGSSDGRGPGDRNLLLDSTGNLYGTAYAGSGQDYGGEVYRLKHSTSGDAWTFSVLYNFPGAPNGAWPRSSLVPDSAGKLYSTTQGGGTGQACTGGCGTVFDLRP
jgi:hypothetical protein